MRDRIELPIVCASGTLRDFSADPHIGGDDTGAEFETNLPVAYVVSIRGAPATFSAFVEIHINYEFVPKPSLWQSYKDSLGHAVETLGHHAVTKTKVLE